MRKSKSPSNNNFPRRHRLTGEEAAQVRQARVSAALLHFVESPDERTRDARDRFGFLIREAFEDPEAYKDALEAERQRRLDTIMFIERMAEAYGVTTMDFRESVYVYPAAVVPEPEAGPDVTYQAHVGEL